MNNYTKNTSDFSFITSAKIIFGWGSVRKLPEIIKEYGERILVLISPSAANTLDIKGMLESCKKEVLVISISGEPSCASIQKLTKRSRGFKPNLLIGIGGGSVIDTGKAVSALITNPEDVMDYLEVVGEGKPLSKQPCPYIAIPTTSGTGSEVTKNAVLKVNDKKVKVSMRSPLMIPRVAIVDPEFTISVPKEITASTGMDAFIQVIEPYVTRFPNRMVDMFCREAIPLGAKYLSKVYEIPSNQEARINLSWVSLLGGLSLANAKLGAVHGFAGPIGGMFNIAHGKICASLLPAVFQVNVEKIRKNPEYIMYLNRMKDIAYWVSDLKIRELDCAIEWFKQINRTLNIPGIMQLGISSEDYPMIIEKSKRSSSMKGNPIDLDEEDLYRILELAQ